MYASRWHRQYFMPGSHIPWHAHPGAYAAIVVTGTYSEAGHGGRRRAEAGDIIIHAPFSVHTDRFEGRGAEIVNIPLTADAGLALESGRVCDPQGLLQAIGDDPSAMHAMLSASIRPTCGEAELADLLAADLDAGLDCSLSEWAERHAVPPRTLRRHFHALYSTNPARYRARARAWRAWRRIVSEPTPLSMLAYELGFADQAHMSRAVAGLTGAVPTQWRASLAV